MLAVLLLTLAGGGIAHAQRSEPAVGSKFFTESLLLADLLQLSAQRQGLTVAHQRAMGGTAILWQALLTGAIDAYPEYTGTLREELLHGVRGPLDAAGIRAALAARGLAMSEPMGFQDRYGLAVTAALAERLQLRTLSDLQQHTQLRFALSNEFMQRTDGWPGLRRAYGLSPKELRGMDHTLAYQAIEHGAADVVDVYTTDPQILSEHLRVLRDDRHYFPDYQAIWLYRREAVQRWPALLAAMQALAGRIPVQAMQQMNADVQLQHRDDRQVAARFLAGSAAPSPPGLGARLLARTSEHLWLVAVSLGLAMLIGLPLGIVAAKLPRVGRPVLALCVILQTVPSLAMLVFMIPLFGIGARPAIAALFLYSLLPIVRNTITGLVSIPAPLAESAASLGLPKLVQLLRIELPLAARPIIAGVSTAAVINVGTATLGALIGAGGYGDPILTGIRLDDLSLILEGAIPAALLALLVMAAFQLLERAVTPRGLRPAAND
jgi:osmoprotectant transport system permease protein